MPDVLSNLRPSDVGRWVLFACLVVSSAFVGRVFKDRETAKELLYAAIAVAGYSGLNQGQKKLAARVEVAGAKFDELHRAVNSALTAKDVRVDASTLAASAAAKLSYDTATDVAKLSADTATDVAKISADADASTAADVIASLRARNTELERRLEDRKG